MTCQRACIEAAWSCRAVEEHTEDKTDALMLKGERRHGSKCTAERIKQGPERPQRLRCCLARPGCREKMPSVGWLKQQKWVFWQLWKLEFWDQGDSTVRFCCTLTFWLVDGLLLTVSSCGLSWALSPSDQSPASGPSHLPKAPSSNTPRVRHQHMNGRELQKIWGLPRWY